MTRPALQILLLPVLVLLGATPGTARPQVVVVVVDHLTLADVTRTDTPSLLEMRRQGQWGLMSPGLAHRPDPMARVYATLGAGDEADAGTRNFGLMARTLQAAGLRTGLIGDADGDLTGPDRPAALLLPVPGLPAGSGDGAVPDPTVPGGKRVDPEHLWRIARVLLNGCDLVVVHFGDFARIERENQRGDLLPAAYAGHRRRALQALDTFLGLLLDSPAAVHGQNSGPANDFFLYLVVPTPPLDPQGAWDRLTPLGRVARPAGLLRPGLLSSGTTQTPGLCAARDLAPSVLETLGVAAPVPMTGAVLQRADGTVTDLQGLERLTRLNQDAQNPFFWGLGAAGAVVVFGALGLYLSGRLARSARERRAVQYGLRLLSAWPLALLLAPLAQPASAAAYLALIAGLIGLLALLRSPALILSLTALVLLADGLGGARMVSQSLLSAYALAGIRFYGIGNEYMGVLLGGTLLAPLALRPGQDVWRTRPGAVLTILWFALVTFVLSFPAFGAKAGGAVTAVVTFCVAWLRGRGVRVGFRHLAGSLAAGFGLVFFWAGLGRLFPVRQTHIQKVVWAMGQGRLGYIKGIALRKIGLALRVAFHPGTLLGLLGLALLGLLARRLLRRSLARFFVRRPDFAAMGEAGLWGCLVAVLVNDSGVVAAILLLTCLILPLLHDLFEEETCDSWPWTSVTSASASPSATPQKPLPFR